MNPLAFPIVALAVWVFLTTNAARQGKIPAAQVGLTPYDFRQTSTKFYYISLIVLGIVLGTVFGHP